MIFKGLKSRISHWLVSLVLTGAATVLPVENALAVANINLFPSFVSADPARGNAFMELAGTWNGIGEVTNTTGDSFTLRVQNSGGTDAFDIDIEVDVASGIRLPFTNFPVLVSSPSACNTTNGRTNFTGITATQFVNRVSFNIPNNRDIPAGCTYDFTIGLTTSDSLPFATAGLKSFDYDFFYDDGGPGLLSQAPLLVPVNSSNLQIIKTATTATAVDGDPVTFNISITNTGGAGLFDINFTDFLGLNLSGIQLEPVPGWPYGPPNPTFGQNTYLFDGNNPVDGYLAPGQSINFSVDSTVNVVPDDTTCSILNTGSVQDRSSQVTASNFDTIAYDLNGALTLTHDLGISYCLLCGDGVVSLRVANTGGIRLNNVTVTDDLSAGPVLPSGLEYIPNSVSFNVVTGPGAIAPFEPAGPPNAPQWNIGSLDSPLDMTPSNPIVVDIVFGVRRAAGFTLEGLADPAATDTTIRATATYDSVCGTQPLAPNEPTTGDNILPLRQPLPTVVKDGWNVDSGQLEATATPFVYGHEDDEVIWRVAVTNGGTAPANLEDLLIQDTIGGNFDFIAVCENEPDATAAAGGTIAGTCVARSGLNPADFAPPPNPDVPTGATTNYYYVGTILGSCSNANNTANIEWGCEVEPPAGGINDTNSTIAAANITDTAGLNTSVGGADLDGGLTNQLNVNVQITGTHPTNFGITGQPIGSRGRVTITLTNDTGGTITNIMLDEELLNRYVVDPSIAVDLAGPLPDQVDITTNNPAFDITMTPANGAANYLGMIDTVEWTNPDNNPLNNTNPMFALSSSTSGDGAFPNDVMRHGDVITISFDIVLIDATRYDLLADLDVRVEGNPATDPDNTFDMDNRLTVTYEEACAVPNPSSVGPLNNTFNAFPEDLDVDIVGTELSFILNTDDTIQLPLSVRVANNGGHDAYNYFLLVTFGDAIRVDSAPASCQDISGSLPALPRPYWNDPDPIPVNDNPTVYLCSGSGAPPPVAVSPIAPVTPSVPPGAFIPAAGATDLNFLVSRDVAAANDDLTFRADVVGEITLSDGTAWTFPAPGVAGNPPLAQFANNYSLDAIRARVIGFGLTKSLVPGSCTEGLTYPARDPNTVFIGEDCEFNLISGGWFGFDTPGFGIIAVHTITVFDELPTDPPTPPALVPSEQGFIDQDDGVTSDPAIQTSGIVFAPAAINQLDTGTVSWTFNVPVVGPPPPLDNKLYVKDQLFRANIKTRILNNPTDTVNPPSGLPNSHNVVSKNILNTTFLADFSGGTFVYDENTTGYPVQALREYDLTITEPNIVVTKDVCNETDAGGPGACTPADFFDLVNNGDTADFYVFRIRIENVDDSGVVGVTRSPAFNVVVTDVLDPSDLMRVSPFEEPPIADPLRYPFDNDGLDNDGDTLVDEGDEALILTDNIVNDPGNVVPGEIKFSYTSSTTLTQINPGQFVELYYRIDPDDFIAPLQILTNTVQVKYDTLDGPAGSQNPTQVPTDPDIDLQGELGGARVFTHTGETARVQILPLAAVPKIIVQTATVAGPEPMPNQTPVVVGEEIEYRLRALIPVANLREFRVRDELPAGMSCADVPDVNLDAPPYDAAGFVPGGTFSIGSGITCNNDLVEWNFGDQELTAPQPTNRFSFDVTFIARIENSAITNVTPFNPGVNNCIIRNGGAVASSGSPPVPVLACDQNTYAAISYRSDPSQGSVLIEHLFSPIELLVTEPQLQISKTFIQAASGNPGTDESAGDSSDIFDVRIDIENVGDAAAFNPQVLDNLVSTKYTYLGNIGGTDPPTSDGGITLPLAPPPTGAPGTNQPVFSWPGGFSVQPGPVNAISFIFRVQANSDFNPLETVPNTVEAKWTSLDNATVALNSSGSIGPDGDPLGMRNGYFPSTEPPPLNVENDYLVNNSDTIVAPGLTISKTDLDPGVAPAIGAHKRFQIDIDLPEGVTTNVQIDDNLAFGDVLPAPLQTYVLENEDLMPLDIQYEFFDIQTINGTAPTQANAETIFTAPADETSGTATWVIGTVVTATEDDSPLNATPSVNPRIRITYFARINNDLATNDGDDLSNEATLTYTSGIPSVENVSANTAAVTVVEPLLNVTKVADVATADAGDVIQYTVTISHDPASTADAFDLNIVDTLPASLAFTSGVSLEVNAVSTGNAAPTVAAQTLTWGRNNGGDDALDIPLGQSLELIYTVTVQDSVQPNEVIENSVVVEWTSLDGDITGLERIGIGGADCTASLAPDDYCVGPTLSTVNVVDNSSITKTKSNDSFNLGPAGTDLRIGDIIEYTLTLTLQEGTTRGLTLVDTLPDGLEFVDVVSVNGDIAAPYTSANGFIHAPIAAPVPVPTGPGNNVITWNIGDAVSGIINSAGGTSDFVIVYRAVVTEAEFALPQVATTPVNNTVVLDYLDVNDAAPSGLPLTRLTSTVNLDVQQPIIFLADLIKERRGGLPSGNAVTPGETMDFRLSACNTTGTAPAYNLVMQDILPQYDAPNTSPLLDLSTLTVPVVRINGVLVTDGVEYIYTPPPAVPPTQPTATMQVAFTDAGAIPAGQCATVEFDINVDAGIGSQLDWDNSFNITEYHSLPSVDANADVTERQTYAAEGPVLFNMNTILPINDPDKALLSPLSTEATIGQIVTYQVKVPGDGAGPMQVNMFNVEITDQLDDNVTFVSAVLDGTSQYAGGFSTAVSPTNVLTISVPQINFNPTLPTPGTEQAVFNVNVRINNDAITSSIVAPITPPFGNMVQYSFTGPGGGGLITTGFGATLPANDINIVEPQLTLASKTVANLTQAGVDTNAGDVLRYTLTINTTSGAAYSDAFDLDIIDQLSAGLVFCSAVDGGLCEDPTTTSGVIATTPTSVSGTGALGDPYVLNWNSVNTSATDIDITEATPVTTITYTVRVMDNVLGNQPLSNSALIRWTSLDGVVVGERDGLVANTPADRLYESGPVASAPLTVPIVNNLSKSLDQNSAIGLVGPNDVRIGDIVDYELRISMQEGTSQNVLLTDTLPQGLAYHGIVSINGDNDGSFAPVSPFNHATYTQASAVAVGDPTTGPTTVTWSLGDIVNTGNNLADDDFVIIYRARVLDMVQSPLDNPNSNINLQNSVDLAYGTFPVVTTTTDLNNTFTISIDQPNLSVVKQLDPVVPDTVIDADEILTFTLDISNNNPQSESIAHDLVVRDILPLGLRNGAAAPVLTDIQMPIGSSLLPLSVLPSSLQNYVPGSGELTWDLDTGTAGELSIPVGQTMRLVYQVQVDSNISSGVSINNQAQVLRYHSFDDDLAPLPANAAPGIVPAVVPVREIYGPTNIGSVNLTTAAPGALVKINPVDTLIGIGEVFTYTIRVPDVAIGTTLHDIRITDDLGAIAGTDLFFVSVTAIDDDGQPSDEDDAYIPVNTSGSLTNLVIEDIANGIEIPGGETITVEVSVIMRNTPANVGWPLPADTFANTASYTFNSIDNTPASEANGAPSTTGNLTVVEPYLTLTKTGPAPNNVRFNNPIPYRVVVENAGTGPAYDITITDALPQVADNLPLTGGTCNTPPNNFTLEVFKDDEITSVSGLLIPGVDYTVTHTPAPACTLAITTLTQLAKLEFDEKLVITYDTFLDLDSQNNALLTNTASVSEYFSQDTPAGVVVGEIRPYANDPGSALDEASYTVQVEAADLLITKVPSNLTTGGSGAFADPGDQLHYTINVQNNGPVPSGIFSFTDEPDRLNPAPGYFDFASISNVLVNGAAPASFTTTGGVLSIPNLSLDAFGGANDSLTVEFDINLAAVITSGTVVVNQSLLNVTGFNPLPSDDPAIGGAADPTETLIDSAPAFLVTKQSQDISGDPNVLMQGDILRYTIQVQNIGLEDVSGAYLRDLVPANTSYVTGSTRLNGNVVADLGGGQSPLESELTINTPENTTPGVMRSGVANNVATINFDVRVDNDVVNGAVISNQGFVGGLGAGSGPFPEQASDNPDTALSNDPTLDVVGNVPGLIAQKSVSLFNDVTSNNIVDPGDTLEYTIVVANAGSVDATQVSLVDAIPANSAYVADSVTINGSSVLDANLVSLAPLTVRISSDDLALPNQAANDGRISAGNEATVTFHVTATGVPSSSISNQGTIISNQLPDLLTDADGNSTNGEQPTVTIIGANSELLFTKEVFVVGGGVATAGGSLEYVLTVENIGQVDASNILLVDTIPANVTYQLGGTKLDGSTTFIGSGVSEPGANLQVNYQLAQGVLEPGDAFTVTYRVDINNGLPAGTQILNSATVTWTEMTAAISDTASIEVGGAPGVGVMGGQVWHDVDRDGIYTGGTDLDLPNWTVELYLSNPSRGLFASTQTDATGLYQFKGLPTSAVAGGDYEIQIIPDGGNSNSASLGRTVVDTLHIPDSGTLGEMEITGITLDAGVNIANQHLPVLPHGVVYDAVLRTPVAGATLALQPAGGGPLPANCLPVNSNQALQVTAADGFYRFEILGGSCAVSNFEIVIASVPNGIVGTTSQIIPPGKGGSTQIDVPTCPGSADDTILTNADCDIQFAPLQPPISVPVRTDSTQLGAPNETQGTTYYLEKRVTVDGEVAHNNHIPLDPNLTSAVAVTKTAGLVNVSRGQLVPYVVTLTNNLNAPLTEINLVDAFPAGFKYVAGSSRIDKGNGIFVKEEPLFDPSVQSFIFQPMLSTIQTNELGDSLGHGLTLTWDNIGNIPPGTTVKVKFLLVVGSGVGEGEYINRAFAYNTLTTGLASQVASATVRVVPDPTFDCSDVIGKVFDDKNLNGYQDEGEGGLPNVNVVTARGIEITTDEHGRFHLTCAVVPNQDRGSNFIIKLDERSLPTGYRVTTENPRVMRATRGKMLKFNFGAAIHRVVRLDMANEVFEPGSTEMRPQWLPRIDLLISELAKDPSVLRISYLAENESEGLVDDRLDAVKDIIETRWEKLNCCYQLMIETDVFWRKGGPVDRGEFDD